MKLLYITPMINGEGGVQKMLSIKSNYLINQFDYQIDILTQNNGNSNLFFDFNSKIGLFDIVLSNNKIKRLLQYRNAIKKQIETSNPDIIIVCHSEIKAFILPMILKIDKPIIIEIHNARDNFDSYKMSLFYKFIKNRIQNISLRHFNTIVLLSNESLNEWKNIGNKEIIPNPIDVFSKVTAELKSKKIIVVARNSYEKGLPRLLKIWTKIFSKHPDWILEIYCIKNNDNQLRSFSKHEEILNSVHFYEPVKNISEKYLTATLYLMTSFHEGFPMVLIEAMNYGLPCVAYDCPVGPRAIIENNVTGFLIENDNQNDFVDAVCNLIEDENLRIKMGQNAKKSSAKYKIEPIMNQWNDLFLNLKNQK